MADLFKSLKPVKHNSKSGFDLSQKHVFSSKAGQALPCFALETVPDDYHEIDLVSLVRTQTFNTAAFVRGKQRFDFFFVPYSQLWHPFNQFITRRKDKHSTLQKGAVYCPNVSLSAILQEIYINFNIYVDINGYYWSNNALRLLDLLGYGAYYAAMQLPQQQFQSYLAQLDGKYVNIFRLAAYQHIWYDFYRNKFYDTGDSGVPSHTDVGDYVSFFNFDDIDCTSVANSHIPVSSVAEKARLRGLLGMRYIQWKKDLFTSALPGQQFGVVSSVDLNMSNLSMSITGDGSKIGSVLGNTSYVSTSKGFTQPNGEGQESDFQPGRTVMYAERGQGAAYWASSVALDGNDDSIYMAHRHILDDLPVKSVAGSVGLVGTPSGFASFDVLNLYKAEMLQNWKQSTLRAGNMTDDNYLAHYGVTPDYEGDENVKYLGSFDSPLKVNDVAATSTTGETINGKVGELGAYGTAVASGNKLRIKVNDFGVIMCIASFLPESEYNANMLDKANTLIEEFDFFTEEFENIGLEAVSRSSYDLVSMPSEANMVMGYAPRYYSYKTALDKVHGEFSTQYQGNAQFRVGSLAPWVAPRTELLVRDDTHYDSYRPLRSFYVQPSVFNNVFGVAADSSQATDQFLINAFFDVKSIRPMTVLGLPQF